jgi:hypothetical protein
VASKFGKFQATCVACGATTTKSYARANGGKCKFCVTGIAPVAKAPRGRSYDDIAREGGYEDTMGCSPDVLENRYGSSGDY